MAPIQLTAIITPKSEEKSKRFLGLFEACVNYVEANEPGVHRYELHKGIKEVNGKEQFIVLEGYDSQEVLDSHMRTPPVLDLLAAMEKESLTDTQVVMTTKGPGIPAKL